MHKESNTDEKKGNVNRSTCMLLDNAWYCTANTTTKQLLDSFVWNSFSSNLESSDLRLFSTPTLIMDVKWFSKRVSSNNGPKKRQQTFFP